MECEGDLNQLVKGISWLVGKWKSDNGVGSYPGIESFKYNEILDFQTSGKQPLLKYSSSSSNPVSLGPMHLENGFLRGVDGNNFAFFVAHNFGLVTVEEGTLVGEYELLLKSVHINRMTTSSDTMVMSVERKLKFEFESGTLVQELSMSTDKTPELTKHLLATYTRV